MTAPMVAKTSSGYRDVGLDLTTRTLQVIDYEHHEIHGGSHYFAVGVIELTINQVLDFTWLMPNTTSWIHWAWKIDTKSETNWLVYEGATATNALTSTVTAYNSNRNSTKTSGTVLKYEVQANLVAADGDTSVVAATLLEQGISGAGRTGGDERREHELILKQNTLYCLRAIATVAGYVNFSMQWYEHTDKT